MPTISIHLPDDLKERVDDSLDYGDSRSAMIQEALEKELKRRENGEA
jgi:metal-responsive CopG/Arc/MetJ family transcriptional regulator